MKPLTPIVTSCHVIAETMTLLSRWTGRPFAAERGRAILGSDTLRVLRPDPGQEITALADYQNARERLESDPDLRRSFEAECAYYDQHEELLANVRLPDSARASMRERVRAARKEEHKTLFWPKRALAFAAAASIVVEGTSGPSRKPARAGAVLGWAARVADRSRDRGARGLERSPPPRR